MKLLRNIGLIATLVVLFTSCFEKDPEYVDFPSKDVDFIYAVAGDEYILDYYVVSEIQFTNTSAKTGNVTWDFGDGTTSNEANPIHKYAKAGTYQVKLTIEGVGSCSYPIMIYDIAPVLSVKSQSADVVTINDVTVDFNIFLPNPENLKVKYVWTFPEGTTNEAGDEMTEFVGYADENGNVEYPGKLKFRNIGSQRITLQTWFDTEGENRQLEDSYVNVQVGANHECKTLYYAALDGNIKALEHNASLDNGEAGILAMAFPSPYDADRQEIEELMLRFLPSYFEDLQQGLYCLPGHTEQSLRNIFSVGAAKHYFYETMPSMSNPLGIAARSVPLAAKVQNLLIADFLNYMAMRHGICLSTMDAALKKNSKSKP